MVSRIHRDIYFHETQWAEHDEPRKGDKVTFIEDIGKDRRPFARQITRE
jgi:hypothetical protein